MVIVEAYYDMAGRSCEDADDGAVTIILLEIKGLNH
jgi:hypothetical protein